VALVDSTTDTLRKTQAKRTDRAWFSCLFTTLGQETERVYYFQPRSPHGTCALGLDQIVVNGALSGKPQILPRFCTVMGYIENWPTTWWIVMKFSRGKAILARKSRVTSWSDLEKILVFSGSQIRNMIWIILQKLEIPLNRRRSNNCVRQPTSLCSTVTTLGFCLIGLFFSGDESRLSRVLRRSLEEKLR